MRRSTFALAFVLILVIAVVARYKPAYYAAQLFPAPDAAEYAIAGVSLYQHGTFTLPMNHLPYPPQYPYGFPLLLVPAFAVFGPQAHYGLYAALFYSVAVVGLVMVIARRLFGQEAALVAGLVVAIGRAYVSSGLEIMSDAASVVLLLAIGLLVMNAGDTKRPYPWLAAAGLLAGLATVVRLGEAAVLGSMAVAILVLLRRSPRQAVLGALVFGLGALPPIIIQLLYNWQAFGSPFTTGYEYWQWALSGTARDFLSLKYTVLPSSLDAVPNISYYAGALLGLDLAPHSGSFYWPPFVLAILAGVVALVRGLSPRMRRDVLVLALLALGNLSIYLVTVFQISRYVMLTSIVLTMVGARGVVELAHMCREARRSRRLRLILGATLLLVTGSVFATGALAARDSYFIRVNIRDKEWYEIPWRYEEMLYLDREMAQDGVIISGLPAPYIDHYVLKDTARAYLPIKHKGASYAGKPPAAQWPVADEQPELIEAAIRQGRAVYLLDEPFTRQHAAAVTFLRSRFSFQDVGTLAMPRADPQTLYQLRLLDSTTAFTPD